MRRRSSLKLCFGALKTLTLFKLHWIGVKIKICHRRRRRQPQSEDPPRKESLNKEEQKKKSLCQNKMLSLITHLFLLPFGKQRWLEWRRRAHGVGSIYTPPIPLPLSLAYCLFLTHTTETTALRQCCQICIFFPRTSRTNTADSPEELLMEMEMLRVHCLWHSSKEISKEKDSASERGHHSSPPRKKKKKNEQDAASVTKTQEG